MKVNVYCVLVCSVICYENNTWCLLFRLPSQPSGNWWTLLGRWQAAFRWSWSSLDFSIKINDNLPHMGVLGGVLHFAIIVVMQWNKSPHCTDKYILGKDAWGFKVREIMVSVLLVLPSTKFRVEGRGSITVARYVYIYLMRIGWSLCTLIMQCMYSSYITIQYMPTNCIVVLVMITLEQNYTIQESTIKTPPLWTGHRKIFFIIIISMSSSVLVSFLGHDNSWRWMVHC